MASERIDIEIRETGSRIVQRNLDDLARSSAKTASSIDLLKRALLGLSFGALFEAVIRLGDSYTTLQNKLRAAGVEGVYLTKITEELFKISNETRSSAEATATMFSRVALSARETGVSYQQLLDFTKSLNQAIILSGATGHEAAASLTQLSQAIAANRLGGDELRSILEQLPVVADVIAKKLKVTRGELKELGSQGKITAKVVLDAFKEAREELSERFARTIPTVAQSMVVLQNAILKLVGEMDKAIQGSATLSQALMFIAANIDPIAKGLAVLASALAVFVTGGLIMKLISLLRLLWMTLLANPIIAVIALIAALAAALYFFGDDILIAEKSSTSLLDVFRALGAEIMILAGVLGGVASEAWNGIVEAATAAGAALAPIFGPILDTIKKDFETSFGDLEFTFEGVVRGIARVIDHYIGVAVASFQVAKVIYNDIITLVTTFGNDMARQFANAWVEIVTVSDKVWSEVSNIIEDFWNSATKFINERFVSIYDGIIQWAKGILKVIAGWLPDGVLKFFGWLSDQILGLFKTLYKWTVGIVNDILDLFGEARKDVQSHLGGVFDGYASSLKIDLEKIEGWGRKIGETWTTGIMSAPKSNVEWWAIGVLDDATKRANKRVHDLNRRREREGSGPSLTGTGKDLTKLPEDKNKGKGSKELENLKKQIEELMKKLNDFDQAVIEFDQGLKLIDKGLAKGVITQTEYNHVLVGLEDRLRGTVDETYKVSREFEQLLQTVALVGTKLKDFRPEDALRHISSKFPDLFLGTSQELDNKVNLYAQTVEKIKALQQAGLITEQAANNMRLVQAGLLQQKLMEIHLQMVNIRLQSGAGTFADTWIAALAKVTAGFTTFHAGVTEIMGDFMSTMVDGIANSIGRAIVYSEDLSKALYDLARGALASLISAFIKLGIQWLINELIAKTIATTGAAMAVGLASTTGAAIAAAMAPAAAMTSLASYGANAAPAQAAIATTVAMAKGLAAAGALGFAKGGYTGNIGKNDIAGMVHGKEFVMNAAATRNIGVGNLEALQRSAMTGRAPPSSMNDNSAGGLRPLNVIIQNYGSDKNFEVQQISADEVRVIARDEVKRNAGHVVAAELKNPNSSASKSMEQNISAQRRRG